MKRRLFNILTAVSLVMCVASAVLCVRSFWGFDVLGYKILDSDHSRTIHFRLLSAHGDLYLICDLYSLSGVNSSFHWCMGWRGDRFLHDRKDAKSGRRSLWQWLAFDWETTSIPSSNGRYTLLHHTLRVPYWQLVLLFALGLIPAGKYWRRDRRRPRCGLCLTCGYNLTGNVSGVCPECGTAVPPALLSEEAKR